MRAFLNESWLGRSAGVHPLANCLRGDLRIRADATFANDLIGYGKPERKQGRNSGPLCLNQRAVAVLEFFA
jgi:hypothetical protein